MYDYADYKFYAELEFIDDWNLALDHFEESKFEGAKSIAGKIRKKFAKFEKLLSKDSIYSNKENFE